MASTPKFTPGPWEKRLVRWSEQAPVNGFRITTAGKYSGVTGQNVYEEKNNARYSSEEIEANASLIVAAPEMYEALNELLRVDDDWHGSVNSEMATARAAARAAIKKAGPLMDPKRIAEIRKRLEAALKAVGQQE